MYRLEDLLQTIDQAPDGPSMAAIFDFDGTVIAGYSATVFLREQVKRSLLSRGGLIQVAAVNPASPVQRCARDRDWPMAAFVGRGRATFGGYLRSAAATRPPGGVMQ